MSLRYTNASFQKGVDLFWEGFVKLNQTINVNESSLFSSTKLVLCWFLRVRTEQHSWRVWKVGFLAHQIHTGKLALYVSLFVILTNILPRFVMSCYGLLSKSDWVCSGNGRSQNHPPFAPDFPSFSQSTAYFRNTDCKAISACTRLWVGSLCAWLWLTPWVHNPERYRHIKSRNPWPSVHFTPIHKYSVDWNKYGRASTFGKWC